MSILFDINKDNLIERALSVAEQSGVLRLSKRTLKSFPSIAIKFNFGDLLTLDLSQNKITDYPKQLYNCPFLSACNLSHNLLKSLPDDFDQLRSLQQLDLSYNCLTELPRPLYRLSQLQVLIICNNKIVRLPDECANLTELVVLDVSNNQLHDVSPNLGNLKNLKTLKLRNNALESVPSEWCQLRLRCLDLSVNLLTSIPPTFSSMQSCLTQLNLELNPMSCPPTHVCARGPSHVLKYLAAFSSGAELPWHYAKAGGGRPRNQRRQQSQTVKLAHRQPFTPPDVRMKDSIDTNMPMMIAVSEDFSDCSGDGLSPIPQQLSQPHRRVSTVSNSSSATQQVSSGALVQFSSSSSVMQRLEAQSSRLGGSSTLPRRRPGGACGIAASHANVEDSFAIGVNKLNSLVSAPHAQSTAYEASNQLSAADAAAVVAMRSIVERRLGIRLPDQLDRLAERLADGELLGRLAELTKLQNGGPNGSAPPISPSGRGRLLDLCQRLGVSELPESQSADPVMRHLVRMSRVAMALEARLAAS